MSITEDKEVSFTSSAFRLIVLVVGGLLLINHGARAAPEQARPADAFVGTRGSFALHFLTSLPNGLLARNELFLVPRLSR
jgi:hypothetical protein